MLLRVVEGNALLQVCLGPGQTLRGRTRSAPAHRGPIEEGRVLYALGQAEELLRQLTRRL